MKAHHQMDGTESLRQIQHLVHRMKPRRWQWTASSRLTNLKNRCCVPGTSEIIPLICANLNENLDTSSQIAPNLGEVRRRDLWSPQGSFLFLPNYVLVLISASQCEQGADGFHDNKLQGQ